MKSLVFHPRYHRNELGINNTVTAASRKRSAISTSIATLALK
jgi:hypothetical protein